MSIITDYTIWLQDEQKTRFAGKSLSGSLYGLPLTLLLDGELGAGKTTFMQGFAKGLGIAAPLTSPTYALEQRYRTQKHGELLHLDLYRMNRSAAAEIVASTDDYEGIRCIEWSTRLPDYFSDTPHIAIHLQESSIGRTLTVTFHDMRIPHDSLIDAWTNDVLLPDDIRAHCEKVSEVAILCAQKKIEEGCIIRTNALRAAARVHDLFRFVDFKATAPVLVSTTAKHEKVWDLWKQRYEGWSHEKACASFLRDLRFDGIASMIETHGLQELEQRPPVTIEQQLLFYADKRVMHDRVVSLDERFADFAKRYGAGSLNEKQRKWLNFAKKIEQQLFDSDLPALGD